MLTIRRVVPFRGPIEEALHDLPGATGHPAVLVPELAAREIKAASQMGELRARRRQGVRRRSTYEVRPVPELVAHAVRLGQDGPVGRIEYASLGERVQRGQRPGGADPVLELEELCRPLDIG